MFDFESICVQEETFRDTKTATWIEKHVPISVSISSNLLEEPIFICNSDSHHLIASFIGALENLASQSEAKMKNIFRDIETTIKVKLGSILEKLTQRHNRRESASADMSQDDCDSEICASTQFPQIQKNQLNWFGFNSAKYDLKLIKSFLLPFLVNERENEPTVINKANQFISFKFCVIRLLDILNFLGAATSLIHSSRHTKLQNQKTFPLQKV